MKPLLDVLVAGGTVQEFVDEMIVEDQLDVSLDREGAAFVVRKREANAPAYAAVGYRFDPVQLRTIADQSPTLPLHHRIARRLASWLPSDPLYTVVTLFSGIFVLGVFGSITRFFQEYLSETTAIAAINDIRKNLYDHMLHLPLNYYTRHGSSDLTARLVSDAAGLQDGFKTILGKAVQEPITASFALAAAMYIEWRLTIFVILFTPIIVTVIRKLGKKVRRAMRATLERNAVMLGQIESSFVGVRVVKSAVAEPFERRRYRHILESLRTEQNRMAKYDAWSTPTLEMLGLLAVGTILIFASYLVFRDHSLEGPDLILLMVCLVAIAEPLRRISKLNAVLQKGNAAAGRIYEILNEPREIERGSGNQLKTSQAPIARATFHDAIAFERLTFSYPGAGSPALKDVNLRVNKGTSVAIVGRNGSGKTTLLSLLPRFFEPDSGAITIDGLDIRRWPLRKLRRLIGIVTQEAVLFPGSIADNIAYADPTIPRDAVIQAATRAYAHDFITQKPNGYDTAIEGLGGQLSGGQRQRINIARAILRDTPILILDEATSQVDAESEHLIQNAIAELMKDRTTFVIAHRFSTILSADVIVVMEQGQIVGTGKHEDLLATCDTYKQLYERQLVN
jgi:ATP-binding cassette, subfamily B, bacterial MsbA